MAMKKATEFCLVCGIAKGDSNYGSYKQCSTHEYSEGSDFPDTWTYWVDINGQEYTIGDKVAAAGKEGTHSKLYIGTVSKIHAKNSKGSALWISEKIASGITDASGRSVWKYTFTPSATIQIGIVNPNTGKISYKTFLRPENVVKVP